MIFYTPIIQIQIARKITEYGAQALRESYLRIWDLNLNNNETSLYSTHAVPKLMFYPSGVYCVKQMHASTFPRFSTEPKLAKTVRKL